MMSSEKDEVKTMMEEVGQHCLVGYFRISLSLCSQALLWKTIVRSEAAAQDSSLIPTTAVILLWSVSAITLILTSITYALKCVVYFEGVKREFLHHVGVNYFYAPWTSALLLLHAWPWHLKSSASAAPSVWALVLVAPIVALDVKIYGQWLTKGKRFLSRVANPASQLSVIANLVAAAQMAASGWTEFALFLFALGMAHYLVLFVTLYQRLPGGDGLPPNLRPVFFLFIATPSMASLAWSSIHPSSHTASKMLFFLSLFLFISLGCRPALFRKSMRSFSVAWWSYAFSITLLALAAYTYADQVKTAMAHYLMLLLSVLSMLLLFVLLVFTVFNANNLLFGNHVDQDRSSNGNSTIKS